MLSFLLLGHLLRFAAYALVYDDLSIAAYVEQLCQRDCRSYSLIAEQGYPSTIGHGSPPEPVNWVFFPLYPMLVRALHVIGIPTVIAGTILSNTLAIAAVVASRPLFALRERAYWLFAFLVLTGPFSLLLSTLYTESLFIFLTILGFVALQRQDYLRAAIAGAFLSATRVTGVLFVFAILVQFVVDKRQEGMRWTRIPTALLREPQVVLAIFLAPLGLFLFIAFLRAQTGDGFAFARTQILWFRELGNPFAYLANSLFGDVAQEHGDLVQFGWGAATVFGLLLCGLLLAYRQYAPAIFCTLCILVSLSAGVFSMLRFTIGLAPLGVAACILLSRWRPLYFVSYALFALACIPITMGWYRQSLFVI